MKSRSENDFQMSRRVKPWVYITVLFINVCVFVCIGLVYSAYSKSYDQKLMNENIRNVESINSASANAAYTYAASMSIKTNDIVNFVETNNLDFDQTVKYLIESNTNPDRQFQLVLSGSYGSTGELSFGNYSGISIHKTVMPDGSLETSVCDIVYGSGYYDILRSFTDVNDTESEGMCFTPEFTDPDTKSKCFAAYRHINLENHSGMKMLYTLLLVVNSQTALNAYNMRSEYDGQSTVLVNSSGDYIIKNSDYRNVNFYDYIINYNNLTLNWRTELHNTVHSTTADGRSSANLFYKNHKGEDCIFSLIPANNGWYSITCVPVSSFHLNENDINYSLIILLSFVGLFCIDGIAIYLVGKLMNYNISVAEHAEAAAVNANKAKSRFLSTMSHELRTPLNAIIGLVSLSWDSFDDREVLREYLRKIDVSSKLLVQLISDILDVSVIENNKMKLNNTEFDMTRLITSLSAIYYDQCAAKDIEFNVILKDIHSETIIGDSVRVTQILLNFLSNAVKFTPANGEITLRVEQLKRDDTSLLIRFDITDNGCGISEELSSRLFKPFERADGDKARKYGGTGLGLSIAKSLAELMHGKVGMESREGFGSRFFAEIPFGIPAQSVKRSFSPIENLRALIVVHNADEREYIGQILTSFGIDRTLTDNMSSAMELLYESSKSDRGYNLCILDWKTSDINVLEATKKIREHFSKDKLHIIILAYDIAETKNSCIDAGADLVFPKPVFSSALYNSLLEITTGEKNTVPHITENYDFNGKRVLLVEDNHTNTLIACRLLQKVGLDVEVAANGQVGFNIFSASKPGYFNAILMDVQMPVMDGYEATAAIRACEHPEAKTIPILAMTADAFSEDVEKSQTAGMNEHLSKPIIPENLYATLHEYLFSY